jgi:ubiquinone/menaquinone biosynthesis C-methylase UbiE
LVKDKSLFFYGSAYHRFIDPTLAETHRTAVSLIPEGSRVLDIACGTGAFSIMLREQKNCQVQGIDLSLRMLEFARRINPYPDVTFHHEDATDLSSYTANSFDYATILMLLHENQHPQQLAVLSEALHVARKVVMIDSLCPLPKNAWGTGIRLVEATIGRDHYPRFKAFLANGGLGGILKDLNLPVKIEHRSVFSSNCREALILSA